MFSLDKGGAEKVFSLIANSINPQRFDTHFLTINKGGADTYLLNKTVNHKQLNHSRVLFSLPSIYHFLRTQKPDVIISTLIPVNIAIGLLKKFGLIKNIQCVLRESSIPSINGRYSRYSFLFYNSIIKFLYKEFDVIIAQCNDMKFDLINNYDVLPDKIKIINNPFSPIAKGEEIYSPTDKGKKILINIGNLRNEKGHLRLVQVISKLKSVLDFELWILGEGIMREKIIQLIKDYHLEDHIKLFGNQKNIYPFLGKADLMLQTSFYEGFPNALLEAMGSGVPVVAYDVPGGTKDLIINGFNGFLVPDNDEKRFVETIERALVHRFNHHDIIDHVVSNYSIEKIVAQYEQVISNSSFI